MKTTKQNEVQSTPQMTGQARYNVQFKIQVPSPKNQAPRCPCFSFWNLSQVIWMNFGLFFFSLFPFSFEFGTWDLGLGTCSAQNVGISASGTVPDNTAMLDVVSTTRGMLIPRMTTAERNAIGLPGTPATGLQIYNTDCKVLEYWSGTCWISMSKALGAPRNLTGATDMCAATVQAYTITAVPGATYYNWTVPAGATFMGQGTISISVTFGNFSGQVCVTANNDCETSPATCTDVAISPIPNTPGNITGPLSVSPGENSVKYFIASVEGASIYNWTVPFPGASQIISGAGTTTITVNYACNVASGNIEVTAQSTCGISAPSTLAITRSVCGVGVCVLTANAGPDVSFGSGIGASPTASGGNPTSYAYSWSPTSRVCPNATVSNPTASPSTTTVYTVTVTDANGCTANDAVTVTGLPAFNYTGGSQTFTVPCGVTSLTFDVYGAQGTNFQAAGGLGGRAQGNLAVTPGQVLNVYVGGQAGFNGGGAGGSAGCSGAGVSGGGASDIRVGGTALSNRVIVGGGGGGGGSTGCSWTAFAGGVGGGTTGGSGAGCCGGTNTGGTQVGGGSSSNGCGCGFGGAGALGTGGNGGPSCSGYGGASGGGGGYYGGAGGEACGSGWSGAGGSSYTGGVTGGSTTSGVRSGNGQIVITY